MARIGSGYLKEKKWKEINYFINDIVGTCAMK